MPFESLVGELIMLPNQEGRSNHYSDTELKNREIGYRCLRRETEGK